MFLDYDQLYVLALDNCSRDLTLCCRFFQYVHFHQFIFVSITKAQVYPSMTVIDYA